MNTNEFIVPRLARPQGPIDVVIATDAYNEVDDQFAIAYLIRSDDKLRLQAIYAAPFQNEKASAPGIGMELSYQEIGKIVSLCGRPELSAITFRGAAKYLPDEHRPVESEAARDLVRRAMEHSENDPLYVVAIAAATNVASALLMKPEISRRVVVVWLGGNAYFWPDTREFNLFQDVEAARVLFGCGVPLIQLPCMGVVTHLATTGPELKYWMEGRNELCDYLFGIGRHDEEEVRGRKVWNRVIWDISTVAWLLHDCFTSDILVHSPIPTFEGYYTHDETRHLIKYVYHVHRDPIFQDLFMKLAR